TDARDFETPGDPACFEHVAGATTAAQPVGADLQPGSPARSVGPATPGPVLPACGQEICSGAEELELSQSVAGAECAPQWTDSLARAAALCGRSLHRLPG